MDSAASSPATARPESPNPAAIDGFIDFALATDDTSAAGDTLVQAPAAGARAAKVAEVLDTLVALGQASTDKASGYAA